MLEALFDIAQQAGDDGPGYVIEALGLVDQAARCPDPALGAADLRALSAFERLLGQLGPDATDLAAVGQALSVATCPPPRGESLVSVTDVLSARAMRWDHVFLLGCNEGGFPQPARDDALLSDARRSQWRGRLDLDTRSELSGREMLLFYLAISRCDKSLTVSYVEGEAGPASASHFLQALAEAFGPRQLPVERLTAGDLLPDSSELASRRDGRLAGICGLFQRRLDPDAAALAYARAHDPDYLRGAGEGIWVRAARWSAQPCGRFDGRLSRPELIEQLARRLGPDHVYSASQLNLFASCRWAFFARYVLGLEPLIEPRRQLEAADRGSFCHEVLYRLMTDLRCGYGEAFSLEAIDADRLISALDKAGKEASQPIEDAYPDYPMLWAIQRDDMLQQLRRYLLTQHAPSRLQPTHLRFELAFGIDDAQTLAQSDPDSTPDPVTVTLTGDQQIRLRGKIDRVDRAEFAGQVGLMVIDYKTGRLASRSDLDEGRDVQLALYIQAVRALLEEPTLGGAYHQVLKDQQRCFGPMKRWGQEYRADEGFDDRCAEALAAVARYVEQMRSGDFSLYPLAQCESWCPYRWICQHSPAREQIKQSDDTDADREGRP
jgi:ATP-dependent helicase/nuclease subunit B